MDEFYWAALGAAKGIGAAQLIALVNVFGSAQNLFETSEAEILQTGLLPEKNSAKFFQGRMKNRDFPKVLQEQCERLEIRVVPIVSKSYPERLKRILRPPVVLYVKGELPECRYSIGIVGSRLADAYGVKAAAFFAESLAKSGIVIVSGGAKGIDAASHQGALQAGGKTVAVLGCGVDIVYPPANAALFNRIREHGALVSEYPPGTDPKPFYFPERNRIISGISQGIVLVEGAVRSGALITAEFALDEGREVFCVPGNIFSDISAGPHKLIKEGARLADSPEDVLQDLFPELRGEAHSDLFSGLTDTTPLGSCSAGQRKVLDILTRGPQTLEQLLTESCFDIADLSVILLELQMKGFVCQDPGQRYIRI